jgi:CSLREA domain-containing protein
VGPEPRRPAPTRSSIRRLFTVMAAVWLVVSSTTVDPALAAPTTCTLVPQLRDVTVTQGVGSYARLVRGKEALARFYLSLPSCASTSASIAITGATLTVSGGGITTNPPLPAFPVLASPYPLIAPYTSAAALDAPGDPRFVIPGSALRPGGTTASFTATFSATINYLAKTSKTDAGKTGTITFSKLPGTQTDITRTVERLTRALRILAVPMGDAAQSYASQFSASAQSSLEAGMLTLSRIYPVPDGTGDLATASGGVRYTILPTLLDIGGLMSGGKFCGGGANFDSIKGQLAQFLLSWNSANPSATADRVVGVVDQAISNGSSLGCADGWSAIGTPESWVRAITTETPGRTGALLAMEVGHSMGMVPTNRDHTYDPYHSPNQEADGGTNRGYDIRTHLFIGDDRTSMRGTGTWNNATTLLEPIDYAFLLCMLGGSITTDCSAPGSVGTSTGVGAGPKFVISGTTNGTTAGTMVVESYFAANVAVTEPPASSQYFLRQSRPGAPNIDTPVAVETVESLHAEPGDVTSDSGSSTLLFAAVVPFNELTTRIEFRKTGVTQPLYARDRTAAPVMQTTTVSPAGEENYTADGSVDDTWPTVSPDGGWVAWVTDPSEGFSRIWVGPVDDSAAARELLSEGTANETQPAWNPDGDELAYIRDGDVVIVAMTFPGGVPTFGAQTVVYDADQIEPGGAPSAGHPSWSPDGEQIAFDANGAIFVVDALEGFPDPEQLTFTGDASHPSWSWTPGDNRIAYQREAPTLLAAAGTATFASYVAPNDDGPEAPATHGGGHFTVTHDDDVDDGACDATHCSLREAIDAANLAPNFDSATPDVIDFAIDLANDADGILPHVIQPLTALPEITDQVVIDGAGEPDYDPGVAGVEFDQVPAVEIDGTLADPMAPATTVDGLTFSGSGADRSIIDGLVIAAFSGNGIVLAGADRVAIERSYVGTDPGGSDTRGNGDTGIAIDAATYTSIGSDIAETGNLISGNGIAGVEILGGYDSYGTQLYRNYIGTDPTGTTDIPNGQGVYVDSYITEVGGVDGEESVGNLISGNVESGVIVTGVDANNNYIIGNRIGTTANGSAALPNGDHGVLIDGATDNLIGGTGTNEGNLISGNVNDGIQINGSAASGNSVEGNFIGTNATGTAAIPNGEAGVELRFAGINWVGGSFPGARNVISGNENAGSNGTGVVVTLGGGVEIVGNYIGTNASGTAALPNDVGVLINSSAGNTIGGYTPAERNVISGNDILNVFISSSTATGNHVIGNYIGPAADGMTPLGNAGAGIRNRSPNNFIGEDLDGAGNVISGNAGPGIDLAGDATGSPTGNIIQRNLIGVAADGTTAMPNAGNGIGMSHGNNDIGGSPEDGNVIANNAGAGVVVGGGTGSFILGNSIYANGGLGIDLVPLGVTANDSGDGDPGANDLQNFPGLTSATDDGTTTTINGTLNSVASATYAIEVFSNAACNTVNGNGEGRTLVASGSVTTDGTGNGSFTLSSPDAATGDVLTATATNPGGSTSEFSQCRTVTGAPVDPPSWVVNQATDTNDGACTVAHCTLREAINRSNSNSGPDTITFNIPPAGARTITPTSQLPPISDPVTIDATTQPGYAGTPLVELNGSGLSLTGYGLVLNAAGSTIRGFVINRFPDGGIRIDTGGAAAGSLVADNVIGTDALGTTGIGSPVGILVFESPNNTIRDNVISGSSSASYYAVGIFGGPSGPSVITGNRVEGNLIGTDASGTTPLGNAGDGVVLNGVSGSRIGGIAPGEGNVIANSGGAGVLVVDTDATANAILGNSIHDNGSLGIDLGGGGFIAENDYLDGDSGPNGLQNYPSVNVSSDGTTIYGALVSQASKTYRIELFRNGGCDDSSLDAAGANHGEGEEFLGFVNVTTQAGSGYASFTFDASENPVGSGEVVTATATDPLGNTSEFSACAARGLSGTQVWTLDPSSPGASQNQLVADAAQPSFGDDGRVAFVRDGAIYTVEAGSPDDSELQLTTPDEGVEDSMPSLGGIPAFGRFFDNFDGGGQFDAFLLRGQVQVLTTVTDANPQDLRLDLFYQCDGPPISPAYDIAVGLPPDPDLSDASSASWITNYDPSLACPDGTLTAIASDGFLRSTPAEAGDVDSDPQAPIPTIYAPLGGQQFLQYQGIALHGDAKDAEDGQVTNLQWLLDGNPIGTGGSLNRTPPTGGWPVGVHAVTLRAIDSSNTAVETSVQITILADADNDWLPANVEDDPCFPAGADSDPTNAFADYDNDGYSNLDDLYTNEGPCVPAHEYSVLATFGPDVLYVPSRGDTVSITVVSPRRKLVAATTVRITDLSGAEVSIAATSWTVDKNGVGKATFNRQVVIARLTELGLVGQTVSVTVTGDSSGWTFRGTDTFEAKPAK